MFICERSFYREKFFALCLCNVIIICMASCAFSDVIINEANFPDENFRLYITLFIDSNQDGLLSDEEIAAVTLMPVNELEISSLKGIEYFTALQGLDCSTNRLIELDLSMNTDLMILYCENNSLDKLDLSNNPVIRLDYTDNNIKTLKFSTHLPVLSELYCADNQLESLDLSMCENLELLVCSNNNIESLIMPGISSLFGIDCSVNAIRTLDLSGCE